MKIKLVVVFICAALLAGCATANKINSINLGMTKEDVIKLMGKPASISAKEGTEYLNYSLSETDTQAYYGITKPYYVRIIDGKVDAYGRLGDFDSTKNPTIQIKADETVRQKVHTSKYDELMQLKRLKDEGALSEKEYEIQKKKILDKQ